MKCPHCGYQELDDSAICSRCGKVLKATGVGGEVVEEEQDEATIQLKRQQKVKKIAVPAGAVVVIAAIVVAFTQFVHGAPAQITGAWSDSPYGGALALLSSGLQMQVQSESPGGQIAGTMAYGAANTPISIGRVKGHHIYVVSKTSYVSYTLSGTISQDGTTITGVVTKQTEGSTTPTKTEDTLHKAQL